MFVVLRPGCGPEERQRIVRAIETAGLSVQVSEGHHRIVIGVVGDEDRLRDVPLSRYPGVERVVPLKRPYRLVARETHGTGSVVQVGAARIGGDALTVIAGPCAVEGEEILLEAAQAAKRAGATLLRGGAFKPRTSPYDFQGLGERGLRILRDVGQETGMAVVTEAMDTRHVAQVAKCADMIQIGTRNMQNYALLRAAAETKLPVLLKRGRACTITEWLCAAEYLLDGGNAFYEGQNLFDVTNWRYGYGGGVLWFSPFGPLQLVLGFPVDPEVFEESPVFEFSVGGFGL